MTLTTAERAYRARQRMLDKAAEYTTGTYCTKFVGPIFQRMIRAEAGAVPSSRELVMVDGKLRGVTRRVGWCVCVTCGKVLRWDSRDMNAGHFLASRRNSILFEESNISPQCVRCNGFEGGAPQEYRQWMLAIRGEDIVERLEKLKREVRSFTREELVDMRIEFAARLKAAEERMLHSQK